MPQNLTVMVVEDEVALNELLVQELSEAGYRVLTAFNGCEALTLSEREDVEVFVSDIRMPGMSGLELLETLRRRGNHQPFIVTTGYGTSEACISALRHGAFDFLQKPLEVLKIPLIVHEAAAVARAQRQLIQVIGEKLGVDDVPEDLAPIAAELIQMMSMRRKHHG